MIKKSSCVVVTWEVKQSSIFFIIIEKNGKVQVKPILKITFFFCNKKLICRLGIHIIFIL